MYTKEIHVDTVRTLCEMSPSYSWVAAFNGGKEMTDDDLLLDCLKFATMDLRQVNIPTHYM